MTIVRLIGLALASFLLASAGPDEPGSGPETYRFHVPIAVESGHPVQRLEVPGEAMVASTSPDLADLRVFDAAGKAMPMARIAARHGPVRRDTFPALPILGSADALDITGVSLRLDGRGRARVANVTGTPVESGGATAILGVLFDARKISGHAQSLSLDADLPISQPITFVAEASADLKNWRKLGEQVAYREPGAREAVTLSLDGALVSEEFVRLTWWANSRLLTPVTIRSGTLVTRARSASANQTVRAHPPALTDGHTLEFMVPTSAPVRAVGVVPTGTDVIIPVRIFGRSHWEQSWTLLGQGTAARASAIAIRAGRYPMIRIEADRASPGFTSPPELALQFAPQNIAFLATGTPPFVLAAGKAQDVQSYFPLASLMTQSGGQDPGNATTRPTDRVLQLRGIEDDAGIGRQALLWAILLAATALLAAMAWWLWKRNSGSA
ncbi:DUF3999 family protein [Novosphingopyxis sp.]|uniref:DUF3999 family protein n=1 Tax=Novosphingopyxis sp. TaxID=2709690 RepID=UPI003B590566